jgi:uncharacterized membrane protein YtjA (UPF0391 family)
MSAAWAFAAHFLRETAPISVKDPRPPVSGAPGASKRCKSTLAADLARVLLNARAWSRSCDSVEDHMLYWAAVFFIIALLAAFFGFGGLAAGAAGMAKILFFVFLVLAIVSLIFGRRVPT